MKSRIMLVPDKKNIIVVTKLWCAVILLGLICLAPGLARAQTSGFTYQGRLTDGGTPGNGNYDIQFVLWDSASGGVQVGLTQTLNAVPVSAGIFTVTLDFGPNAFSGANRFLEISARPSGAGSLTLLTPRQQITSTPYAVRSLSTGAADTATNAAQLGGVAASQYIQSNDGRLTDPRTPTAGSTNYIQNSNAQQSASNFNISGNGTLAGTLSASVVNAGTQFNIGGTRVLSTPGSNNTFTGVSAGVANTGFGNSFFGTGSGSANTAGNSNSFFGWFAGKSNKTAEANSFFGVSAGQNNTDGGGNSFVGFTAGYFNTDGDDNSFFGFEAGAGNQSGGENTFIGRDAGFANLIGNSNTAIGSYANLGFNNLINATAVGARARVDQNNSLILGGINGVNGGSDTNVGIGTSTPNARLDVKPTTAHILLGDPGCGTTFAGIAFVNAFSHCTNYSLVGDGANTYINRPSGGAIFFRQSNNTEVSISASGTLGVVNMISVGSLGIGGNTPLCRNAANQISNCSSSLRYKKDAQPFAGGLRLLNSLNPITFKWKSDNTSDLGFGAEDVAKVEPLLVTHSASGDIEGVKYDRITAVLVNAVKEQQAQIQKQQSQIAHQQATIAGLKTIVCTQHARAAVCRGRSK